MNRLPKRKDSPVDALKALYAGSIASIDDVVDGRFQPPVRFSISRSAPAIRERHGGFVEAGSSDLFGSPLDRNEG